MHKPITDPLGATVELSHHITPTLCRTLCLGSPRVVLAVAEGGEMISVQLTIRQAEQLWGDLFMEIAAAKQAHMASIRAQMHGLRRSIEAAASDNLPAVR
jgi:hypothetical protein